MQSFKNRVNEMQLIKYNKCVAVRNWGDNITMFECTDTDCKHNPNSELGNYLTCPFKLKGEVTKNICSCYAAHYEAMKNGK